jgi:hypothetical protein
MYILRDDTNYLVFDLGTIIEWVEYEGMNNVIKIEKIDGLIYYIATPDREKFGIMIVEDYPSDLSNNNYYFNNNIWTKVPPISGDTINTY